MIGAVDKQYLYELLAGIVNQDGEALLAKAQEMAARAIGFDSALSELAMLLQRLALIQAVPSALANDDPERETLLQLSQALSGEQIQLYYQCAIHGKQDLSLAPDEYAGFVMTLLRMLAFAPLAADAHDVGGHIENTELHSAETGAHTAKKPLQLPQSEASKPPVQTTSAPATSSENKVAEPVPTQENNDVPPWEDASSEAETVSDTPAQESAKSIQTTSEAVETDKQSANEAEAPFQTTPQAEMSSENQVSDNEAANHETDVSLAERSSENTDPIQTTPIAEAVEAEAFAHEAPVEPFYDYGSPEHDYPVADSAEMPPPPDWEHAVPADTAETESEAEEDSDDEDGTQFAPLPEFSTENWAAIVRHFARKLGAAQMLAQHAAWTHYDAGSHLMMLSMTDEARATANKERLDKIKNTLAEAYGLPLKLQTEPWRDDAGWETPTMC